jgi:hypothetical protein
MWPQNVYGNPPSGTMIKWDQPANFGGKNNIFAYPTWVTNFYQLSSVTPGDPLTITIFGLSSFATVTSTGGYTLAVPAYQNNPGLTFSWSTSFQDSYTYLIGASSDTIAYSATKVVTSLSDKKLHNTNWSSYNTTTKTYAVNSSQVWYTVTRQYEFQPYITDNNGNYTGLSNPQFIGMPGQTYTKDIYFFANSPY